jgi:hypothetical protein
MTNAETVQISTKSPFDRLAEALSGGLCIDEALDSRSTHLELAAQTNVNRPT